MTGNEKKMFRLLDPRNEENVLGADVSEDNVYVRTYGAPLPGNKRALELDVGESSLLRYSLGGTTGVYRLVRVS